MAFFSKKTFRVYPIHINEDLYRSFLNVKCEQDQQQDPIFTKDKNDQDILKQEH
jgi:hypothetical protein